MIRLRTFAATVGLLTLASTSPAQASFRVWDTVCGGSTFQMCASVQLHVNESGSLLVRMRNLSGLFGSYAHAIITYIAFDNLPIRDAPYQYELGSMTGPMYPGFDPASPDPWVSALPDETNPQRAAFEPLFGYFEPHGGVVSSCYNTALGIPDGGLWASPDPACPGAGITGADTNGGWVEMQFHDLQLQAGWSTDQVHLTIHGIDAAADPMSEGYSSLYTNTEVVPEPISMILLGSGLAGIGGARLRRRKREQPQQV